MKRLRFTYSLGINRQLIDKRGITHHFFIFYGQAVVSWILYIENNIPNDLPPRSEVRFELMANAIPSTVHFRECSCKFILKRIGLPDLEYSFPAQSHLSFAVPWDSAIHKFFENFFERATDTTAILEIVLELPKIPFLAMRWHTDVQMAPVGWENDKRFKFLTVVDKHDFHIICADGVFYAKKRNLIRTSKYFKEKFESEWKNVPEITLDISLESWKVVTAYVNTNIFLPLELNGRRFKEIADTIEMFGGDITSSLRIFASQQLGKTCPSLSDLIAWWKAVDSFDFCGLTFRDLRYLMIAMLAKNYYSEIISHYKPDAVFTDDVGKKMHTVLHEEQVENCLKDEKTLFIWTMKYHKILEKVTVAEIAK